MNIAFYLHRGIYGGGERILQTLMQEFDIKGHNVFVYSPNPEIKKLLPLYHVQIINGNKIKQVFNIAISFRKFKIDAIFMFGTMTHYFLASKLSGVKFIHSLRIDPLQVNMSKLGNWLVYNYSDAHIFQTQKVLKSFNKRIQKASIVIPNPIMDELPEPKKNRLKKIALVGRLSEEKNQAMAIRAFAKVESKGYTLHIFGVGTLETELKSLVHQLNLHDKVFFEGQVKNIVNIIVDYDILLLTSNFEGMPNALIEGMAMGLACISTDFPSGAAHELIDDGENGYVIPMNDECVLAEKLQQLIDNEGLRCGFQHKALDIRNTLEKELIINKWIEFTRKIVSK